jgi:hypothetical protein
VSFSIHDLSDTERIARLKFLYDMPEEAKKAYDEEFDKILAETPSDDFDGRRQKVTALDRKYNLR